MSHFIGLRIAAAAAYLRSNEHFLKLLTQLATSCMYLGRETAEMIENKYVQITYFQSSANTMLVR